MEVLEEIKLVLMAQGAEADPDDLEHLVEIRTWSESCFEFEHFTNEQLADAVLEVHQGYGAPNRDNLIRILEKHRKARADIKHVWKNWRPRVSKTKLAKQLWPVLEAEIRDESSSDAPTIAKIVYEAYLHAQGFRYRRRVIQLAA